jgi:hypothetical protein
VFRNSEPAEKNTQKELAEKIPYPLEVVVVLLSFVCLYAGLSIQSVDGGGDLAAFMATHTPSARVKIESFIG